MSTRWSARRLLRGIAAPLVLAGVLTGLGPVTGAAAATCQPWTGVQPTGPGFVINEFHGVAVLSQCNVWAVGLSFSSGSATQTLIEHWNGSAWKVVPSPDPGSRANTLTSVRALAANNIWAVGSFSNGGQSETLVVHYNGTSWKQVNSPSPGAMFNALNGVRTVSAKDIWAVGSLSDGDGTKTLILHYNGSAWKQVPSPSPGAPDTTNELTSVAATSATNAWAVGRFFNGSANRTLILHWNGKNWSKVASPNPGSVSNQLSGVGVSSTTNAWAVGTSANPTDRTLIVHWNGKNWSKVTSPNPGDQQELLAVTAVSASNAYAVGRFSSNGNGAQTLIVHWNGTKWSKVASPVIGGASELVAVGASSASNIWAVGDFNPDVGTAPLVAHCC